MTALSRRHLLTLAAAGSACLLAPEALYAREPVDLSLTTVDVEADIAPQTMRRISGRAPAALEGVLFRNGPAKFRRPGGSAGHWFDGDGLIRRFAIDDGAASLSARFADTPKRRQEEKAGRMLMPGFGTKADPAAVIGGPDDANAANTSVIMAGGELWALWEAGSPVAMDPKTLETKGFKTLRSDLKSMPFLAHPRIEPDGRIWNLGLNGDQCIVWRLSPSGALEAADVIKLPMASYIHDFTATKDHLVIVLQPWVLEGFHAPIADGLAWKPQLGTKILVLDKADLSKRRTYETEAFFAFHFGDAWVESDGTIRFDVCMSQSPAFAIGGGRDIIAGRALKTPPPELALIALRADGRADITRSGVAAEFPKSDPRRAGLARRRTIHAMGSSVGVHDWSRQDSSRHDFGSAQHAEEFLFVPRPGRSGEAEGWLVGTTLNLAAKATELHVLDAANVAAGPICTWRADLAMPLGFHGTFKQA